MNGAAYRRPGSLEADQWPGADLAKESSIAAWRSKPSTSTTQTIRVDEDRLCKRKLHPQTGLADYTFWQPDGLPVAVQFTLRSQYQARQYDYNPSINHYIHYWRGAQAVTMLYLGHASSRRVCTSCGTAMVVCIVIVGVDGN